jgi:microcin C transport system substrate-binding protein
VDRRSLMKSAALALAARGVPLPDWISPAQAQEKPANVPTAPAASPASSAQASWRHGVSLYGDLKYPEGFKQFDYVNANAPKGGTARQIAVGTFDSFNMVVAGVKGDVVTGITLVYDTLLAESLDEVSSEYGLLAEAVRYPADISSASYRLRAQAKWHDGSPITADDVIFSFNAWKKYSPQLAAYYRHVVKAEKTGDREVTFSFDGPGNRELPQILGELIILPKLWWEGADKNGKKRDIGDTTLELPLGSGPYRIKSFSAGREVVYERVPDYWARSLNVRVGRDNFDELRFEYFRDNTVALEAFKADTVDWRIENAAKSWATAYDFPAVTQKRVILEEFPIKNQGVMQAFAFNIRRDKFKDPRVRLAFNYAFDFEAMNKQLFYGQYTRIASYFQGTDLAATGLPTGRELEMLQAVRNEVPPEVFTTPYTNPVGGTPEADRNNLRQAVLLLRQAGYDVRNERLVDAKTGEPYAVEFLTDEPAFERVVLFYKPSLERLGMSVSVRTIDDAQYQNRLRDFDFDIIINSWGESLSPGNEQRGYWGSQAADEPGSFNLIGIKNPAIDALINQIIFAKSRADLVAATKALDRVLLWNHYVVPQWTYSKIRTARWDRFSRPDPMPKYGMDAFPTLWWWDAAKAAKTGTKS